MPSKEATQALEDILENILLARITNKMLMKCSLIKPQSQGHPV